MHGRVKVGQVPQRIANGIAQFTIGINRAAQNFLGDAHIALIIRERHPQTQNIGPVFIDYIFGVYAVAQRFVHLAAVLCQHHTVGQNSLKRSYPF